MSKKIRINVNFSNVEKINPLFSKCSIRVLYTGLNRNNSYFTEEVVEKNIFSIFNIPIVGEYLEEVDNFGGHGGEIKIVDGEARWVHTTRPYGCVPESASVYWEEITEDNGKVNKYLIIDDALLWTGRYPEVEQLIGQEFGQSMEIEINEGKFKKINGENVYFIEDFVFSALCILGINKESDPDGHVEPCFESASIVAYTLNSEEFKTEYKQMLDEIKQLSEQSSSFEAETNKNNEQGGSQLDEVLKMLESYSVTLEDLQANGINLEDYSLEELEAKIKEVFEKKQNDQYTLTASQLQEEAFRVLVEFGTVVDEYWGFEYPKYSLVDVDIENEYIVAFDNEKWYLVGFDYQLQGDKVKVDKESVKRFKLSYVPMELDEESVQDEFEVVKSNFEKIKEMFEDKKKALSEKESALNQLQEQFNTLEKEYTKVNAEYDAKLKAEREQAENEIFEMFAKELTEDEMADVKANKDNMELEEIKDKLFALVGKKKAKFSSQKQDKPKIINLDTEFQQKTKTGKSYDELFEKYGSQ